MRQLVFVAVFAALTSTATARPAAAQSSQHPGIYASAADVAALVAKAKSNLKPGQPAAGDWIVKVDSATSALGAVFPVGHVHLDYLVGVIPNAALVHERRVELFYVLEGSGVVQIGGTLRDETRMNAETLRGSGVEGGTPQRLAKGDFLILPVGTPHFFSEIDGTLVFMSLMMPYDGDPPR